MIGNEMALEIKSSKKVSKRDHKGLLAIGQERSWQHLLLVSQDKIEMEHENGIRHLHWETFLTQLWEGKFFTR